MKDIIKNLGKKVTLTNTEGKTFEGILKYYNPPADDDDNLAEVVLETKARSILFNESEIDSIEEIKETE